MRATSASTDTEPKAGETLAKPLKQLCFKPVVNCWALLLRMKINNTNV